MDIPGDAAWTNIFIPDVRHKYFSGKVLKNQTVKIPVNFLLTNPRYLEIMKRTLTILAAIFLAACPRTAGNNEEPADSVFRFIVLGDIHYCDTAYYDLPLMKAEKPDDYRQITEEYAPATARNWQLLVSAIIRQIEKSEIPTSCIVQLGDLSEGLANAPGYAEKMEAGLVRMLEDTGIDVPWILVKGNHDITGVGSLRQEAKDAFRKIRTPFIERQTGSRICGDATYAYRKGPALFIVLDAWADPESQLGFLEDCLAGTDARFRFVCIHEPAVPVTGRCWHWLRKDGDLRERYLGILSEYGATVLCAHLHRCSILRRNTPEGQFLQLMVNSVTDSSRCSVPDEYADIYGPGLVDLEPGFSPEDADTRRKILEKESGHVDFYRMNDLAGYAVITIDSRDGSISAEFFPAFSGRPYEKFEIAENFRTFVVTGGYAPPPGDSCQN